VPDQEPIQVGDGGITPPDPVIESWNLALKTFLGGTRDFEGSAEQIAEAMKHASVSYDEFNKSMQRLGSCGL
jgi:hypothetical protein